MELVVGVSDTDLPSVSSPRPSCVYFEGSGGKLRYLCTDAVLPFLLPFLRLFITSRQRQMRGGEGYLFLPGFSFLYDAIHEWMTKQMDEWMDGSCDEKSFTKNYHDVLYYM
jgi:hypothetical protein